MSAGSINFESEIKSHFMQWKHSTSPAPKNAKVVPSARKCWPPSFGMQKALCLSTTFRKVKLLMENTKPIC